MVIIMYDEDEDYVAEYDADYYYLMFMRLKMEIIMVDGDYYV